MQEQAVKKTNTDEDALYIIGWILLGCLILIGGILKVWPEIYKEYLPPCLFQLLTGFYCPGCGGTRAVKSLLEGKLLKSFLLHPFVLYTAVVGGWFMISQTIERAARGKLAIGMKYRDVYLWLALALVAVNFLVKNILLWNGIDVLQLVSG